MGPQLRVDLKTETWRWCQEIAYPPFAFLFVIASNKANPGLGLMMHDWTTLALMKNSTLPVLSNLVLDGVHIRGTTVRKQLLLRNDELMVNHIP